jgi:hypothetical protein
MAEDDGESANLAHCKWLWENENFLGVFLGFTYSEAYKAMPKWLAKAISDALLDQLHNGGADGRGRKGGHLARAARQSIDTLRWQAMTNAIERGCAKPSDEASEMLKETDAQGTPRQIRASYHRMERLIR